MVRANDCCVLQVYIRLSTSFESFSCEDVNNRMDPSRSSSSMVPTDHSDQDTSDAEQLGESHIAGPV